MDAESQRRAYWASLQQGYEEVVGQETTTIRIPEDNLFDIEALQTLMERSRRGEI